MGKKKGLTSLFNQKATKPSWPWPSCRNPKTLSFRADDDMFKTLNFIYLDVVDPEAATDSPDQSCFTNSSECASFSTVSEESSETVLRGLRSERFFFEPGDSKSIMEEAGSGAKVEAVMYKESVAVEVESEDPYGDFRRSMEEMVEAHGLKEWECLEELLLCYLRLNGKMSHGFIVGAFLDLIVGIFSSCLEGGDEFFNS